MKTIEQVQEEVSLEVYRIEYYKLIDKYKAELSERVSKAFAKECLTEAVKRAKIKVISGNYFQGKKVIVDPQSILSILEEIK
jgi:hypothetical protein